MNYTDKKEVEVVDFLNRYNSFCKNIDKYNSIFELNDNLLTSVKGEDNFINNLKLEEVATEGSSFAEKKLKNVKTDLSQLIQQCKNHARYNVFIGTELGIEVPLYQFN